jgi:hypothetical protein
LKLAENPGTWFTEREAVGGDIWLVQQLLLTDAYRPPKLSGIKYDKLDRLIGRETTMCRLNGFRQSLAGKQNPAFSRASLFYLRCPDSTYATLIIGCRCHGKIVFGGIVILSTVT